ncbi:hypothetical protein R3I94_008967 [Phoxinus phoxinus]
MFNIRKK